MGKTFSTCSTIAELGFQTLRDGTQVRSLTLFKLDDVPFVRINDGEREMPLSKFHFLGGIVALSHGFARFGKRAFARFGKRAFKTFEP
jgi:hypothetical protein